MTSMLPVVLPPIEIPPIITTVRMPFHGLNFQDLKTETNRFARMRFNEIFDSVTLDILASIGRFVEPCSGIRFKNNIDKEIRNFANSGQGELLRHLAKEIVINKLEDWEPDPRDSFIRFIARRNNKIIGGVILYNMKRVSVIGNTREWSVMIGPVFNSTPQASWFEIFSDVIVKFFQVVLKDDRGNFHRIVEMRCPLQHPPHRWSVVNFKSLFEARSINFETSFGAISRVLPPNA